MAALSSPSERLVWKRRVTEIGGHIGIHQQVRHRRVIARKLKRVNSSVNDEAATAVFKLLFSKNILDVSDNFRLSLRWYSTNYI